MKPVCRRIGGQLQFAFAEKSGWDIFSISSDLFGFMRERRRILFPVSSVKLGDVNGRWPGVQTMHIDIDALRI